MPVKIERFFMFLALGVPMLLVLGRLPAELGISGVALAFLYRSFRTKDFSWLQLPWVRVAAVTWIYLMISGLLSLYDVEAGFKRGLLWVRFPLFALALSTWLLPLDTNFKWLRLGSWVLLVAISIDALVQAVTGTSITGYGIVQLAGGRLTGPFRDYPVVGVFLSRLGWPALGLAFATALSHGKTLRHLALPLLLTGLLVLTILLSGERMAFAVFGLAGLVFWIGAKEIRMTLFGVGISIAVMAFALMYWQPRLHDRFLTNTGSILGNFENSSYGNIYQNNIVAWKLAPITGVGPKNFYATCQALGPEAGFQTEAVWAKGFNCARHPHNVYMEWLTETGIIGFGLFLTLVFLWARQVCVNVRTTSGPLYFVALGSGVALLTVLWPIMATMSFFINWSATLFWWILALAVYKYGNHPQEQSSN